MTESKVVPIRDVMPVGRPAAPPKRPCGANAPVTWGGLYLMYNDLGKHAEAEWCLDHIMQLDGDAVVT